MRTWQHGVYAALILVGVALCCWRIERAAADIRAVALILTSAHGIVSMDYSSIVFTSGTTTTTYTGVTGYTSHETYVSFTGKGPDDTEPKGYEVNRTSFSSVQLNP